MIKLVLLRHGESIWNRTNKFTGWTDVDLSDRGIIEAENAAKTLISKNYIFNKVYTSVLRRSIRTTWIVLDKMNLMYIPVCISWRLNERMYVHLYLKRPIPGIQSMTRNTAMLK